MTPSPSPSRSPAEQPSKREWFSEVIGRTRFVVLIAVIAVLLVSFSLFLQGTLLALHTIYGSWHDTFTQGIASQQGSIAVEFLEIVSTMLKAVVFYLIGVGLYSLFITPLNLTSALGVESLADLEQKVVSVIIVILGVTFLEHFVRWEKPLDTLYFAGSLALAGGALVFFQRVHRGSGGDLQQPQAKLRARQDLFEHDNEQRRINDHDVELAEQATLAKQSGKVDAGGGSG
ncbi:YqhA family protein [Deinococcus sp. A31D244]|uniref:YqhA family protein n=1 Tax=Deinococcus aquaticus TaxID=328692 RepID=A0ABY7V3I4_9DEIO|nr:YqhA family protein [Deinococcus aquaticus]WDA59761.1 YqhA family protein [Deinococcus aquaticus]